MTLRTYLWLKDAEFVFILERRTLPPKIGKPAFDFYHLVSAFRVDVSGHREDLELRQDAFQKKQLPPKREQS